MREREREEGAGGNRQRRSAAKRGQKMLESRKGKYIYDDCQCMEHWAHKMIIRLLIAVDNVTPNISFIKCYFKHCSLFCSLHLLPLTSSIINPQPFSLSIAFPLLCYLTPSIHFRSLPLFLFPPLYHLTHLDIFKLTPECPRVSIGPYRDRTRWHTLKRKKKKNMKKKKKSGRRERGRRRRRRQRRRTWGRGNVWETFISLRN